MPTSVAELYVRMTNKLALLGDFTDTRDDIIKDALAEFVMECYPLISTTFATVVGTREYSVPATIDKLKRIQDADDVVIKYTLNEEEGTITLDETPAEVETYTVYGTPAQVRANWTSIIAGLNDRYVPCLWAYIVATAHEEVESDQAENKWLKAGQKAHKLRQEANSHYDMLAESIQIKDAEGTQIDVDGSFGETDEY